MQTRKSLSRIVVIRCPLALILTKTQQMLHHRNSQLTLNIKATLHVHAKDVHT